MTKLIKLCLLFFLFSGCVGFVSADSFQTTLDRLYTNGMTRYDTIQEYRPDDYITRGEASKMLSQFASMEGLTLDSSKDCDFFDVTYTDKPFIRAYDNTLIPYIYKICKYGLMRGAEGLGGQSFMPENNLTDAEALTILMRSRHGMMNEDGKGYRWSAYYSKAKEYGLIGNETSSSVGASNITREKLGKWIYTLAANENNTPIDLNRIVHDAADREKIVTEVKLIKSYYNNLGLGSLDMAYNLRSNKPNWDQFQGRYTDIGKVESHIQYIDKLGRYHLQARIWDAGNVASDVYDIVLEVKNGKIYFVDSRVFDIYTKQNTSVTSIQHVNTSYSIDHTLEVYSSGEKNQNFYIYYSNNSTTESGKKTLFDTIINDPHKDKSKRKYFDDLHFDIRNDMNHRAIYKVKSFGYEQIVAKQLVWRGSEKGKNNGPWTSQSDYSTDGRHIYQCASKESTDYNDTGWGNLFFVWDTVNVNQYGSWRQIEKRIGDSPSADYRIAQCLPYDQRKNQIGFITESGNLKIYNFDTQKLH